MNTKVSLYDYGKLAPIYSDIVYNTSINTVSPYVFKVTPLNLGPGLTGSTNFAGSSVDINLNYEYIQSQTRENYVHDQQVASATWVVNHTLNRTCNRIVTGKQIGRAHV